MKYCLEKWVENKGNGSHRGKEGKGCGHYSSVLLNHSVKSVLETPIWFKDVNVNRKLLKRHFNRMM